MCRAMRANGAFDPALCPLLQGLDPEEIARRMQEDPAIVQCRLQFEGEALPGRNSEKTAAPARPTGDSSRA